MPNYWLIVTSPDNFAIDRQNRFSVEGFRKRNRNLVKQVKPGDKLVVYINQLQRVGAVLSAESGFYYDDRDRIWVETDETWPCRFKTRLEIELPDDNMLDIKRLVPQLSFITPRQKQTGWALAFHQSLRKIPEEDFELIESEMKKLVSRPVPPKGGGLTEAQAKEAIAKLPLEKASLHDRLGEMLAIIGSRMGYNTYTNHKVTPQHSVQLDVAWFQGKNPEVACEIQIGGNIVEAKDKLAQAKKFNYRKVIMVIEEAQLAKLNDIVKFDELVDWMEAWSIQAVHRLYTAGVEFLDLWEKLKEAHYEKRMEVNFIS